MTMELVQSQGTVWAACFLTAAAMRMPSTTIWRTKTMTMDMSRSEKGVAWLQLLWIDGEVAYLSITADSVEGLFSHPRHPNPNPLTS